MLPFFLIFHPPLYPTPPRLPPSDWWCQKTHQKYSVEYTIQLYIYYTVHVKRLSVWQRFIRSNCSRTWNKRTSDGSKKKRKKFFFDGCGADAHRTDGKRTESTKGGINSGSPQFAISVGDDLFHSIIAYLCVFLKKEEAFLSDGDLKKVSCAFTLIEITSTQALICRRLFPHQVDRIESLFSFDLFLSEETSQ